MSHGHELLTAPQPVGRRLLRLGADWAELCKARIGSFVVFAAFTGGLLAEGNLDSLGRTALAALFIGLVAGASGVFNQVFERDLDRRMERTRERPLPAGRISVRDAILGGTLLALVGTVGLAYNYNLLAALLALATLLAYVLVYTPLKRVSSLNTVVGALPGAMPPLLGYVALAGVPGPWGWLLFGVIFAWQFPHFLAIAWLYREDYRRAGMKMLPALEGAEGVSGRQALLYAILLVPISLLPAMRGEAGWVYAAIALTGGVVYVASSFAFALRETPRTARTLLLVSLVYLPAIFCAALFDPTVSLLFP